MSARRRKGSFGFLMSHPGSSWLLDEWGIQEYKQNSWESTARRARAELSSNSLLLILEFFVLHLLHPGSFLDVLLVVSTAHHFLVV